MTWLLWLTMAVVVVALAAFTGLVPKGGRPVAGTRLMGVARLVLVALAVLLAYVAYGSRVGQ